VTVAAVRLPDGRRLTYEDAGSTADVPILCCHGFPGCHLQRQVFFSDTDLRRVGVRMITPDRPGYGGSDFQPGRRIEDWPTDVGHLVDDLGLQRFGVVGFSGGTPYALALTVSDLPVGAVGIVSGDAPPGEVPEAAPGLPAAALARPRLAALALHGVRVAARIAPRFTANRATSMLAAPDRAVVADPRLRRAFIQMLREALRQGARGPLLDMQLAGQAWRVRPTRTPIPVHLWHGEDDPDSPIATARYLAARLPGAELNAYSGEGHISVFVHHAQDILGVLAQATAAAGPPSIEGG
jgi:pimeloyl-ACP methyl ester carboxylesterase